MTIRDLLFGVLVMQCFMAAVACVFIFKPSARSWMRKTFRTKDDAIWGMCGIALWIGLGAAYLSSRI